MPNTLPNKAEKKVLSLVLNRVLNKGVGNALLKLSSMCWRFDLISARLIPYLLA